MKKQAVNNVTGTVPKPVRTTTHKPWPKKPVFCFYQYAAKS